MRQYRQMMMMTIIIDPHSFSQIFYLQFTEILEMLESTANLSTT